MITVSSVFSGIPPLFANLSKILSGDIDCSHQALESHSTDGSPYIVRPQAVVYPKNTSDIKHIIAFSREYRMPMTVRGGGSAATGGSLGEGVVIDMTRYFTRIRQVNMMEHTITVDAGVTLKELREKLAAWNMEIPVLRGGDDVATVGGLVATKSATASSFYTGTVREWIEGITVVVDTGEEHHIKDGITPSGRLLGIYQAVFPLIGGHGPTLRAARREENDDATGYFLWSTAIGPRQLLDELVGSEGTLGIVTSVTFRVTITKPFATTYLIPAPLDLLDTTMDIAKHHGAEALYVFDDTYRKLVERLRPAILPHGLESAPFYVLVTFRDNDEHTLATRGSVFLRALPDNSMAHIADEKSALWLESYENLHGTLHTYSAHSHILATLGEGIIVSKHMYRKCLQELDSFIGKTGLFYTLTGYAGSGHISLTLILDPRSPSYEQDLFEYNDKICKIVESCKGGLSATGGDGLERSAHLSYVYSDAALQVFSAVKHAWDPLSIFNPGKKLSISLDYLRKHIRTTA